MRANAQAKKRRAFQSDSLSYEIKVAIKDENFVLVTDCPMFF